MRLITIASLGASAVFGVAALFIARTTLPALANTPQPAVIVQRPAEGSPVVVASKAISFGDKLDARALTIIRLPANAVPEGAFSSIEQVLAQDGGQAPVALIKLAAREVILPSKVSGPGARASVAAEIAPGMRGYTIKVTDVTGVGGHALPGDRVDVVLKRDLAPEGSNTHSFVSQVVLQNVRVLGVDLNADPTSNTPATPSTATLEVSVKDAQKLSLAADLGALSLALRRSGAADIEAVAAVRTGDFMTGGPGVVADPGRARVRRTASAPASRGPLIVVVEGEGARKAAGG
jgi:pilus assembly protein CpaB